MRTWLRRRRLALVAAIVLAAGAVAAALLLAAPGAETGAGAFPTSVVPETYYVDAGGRIVAHAAGPVSAQTLTQSIDKLLKGGGA